MKIYHLLRPMILLSLFFGVNACKGKVNPTRLPTSTPRPPSRVPSAPLPGETASFPKATIVLDATQLGVIIEPGLWGSNLTNLAVAAQTVENPAFVAATRQIGVTMIRWPGGNNASAYDWKRDEMIQPGRRAPRPDGVDIARILQFVHDTGAELSITVNFGTMSAQDAADLVEFLNGPADSTWGAKRAALGFPEPIGVRYFEIGNEENQPHMWYYSWTAENSYKYFFGGDEERRGFYNNVGNPDRDRAGTKGDFFKVSGGPGQTYRLRFPPVRDVQVFGFVDKSAAENCITAYRQTGQVPTIPDQCESWTPTTNLASASATDRVFEVDSVRGELRFGDGVHGAIPPAGSYFLVEYTTYGHQGFLDFARAMRAAPSSVPIQIGAAMLPFVGAQPIADTAVMREIFNQMDFYVRHQYDASFSVSQYGSYRAGRQIAADRVDTLSGVYNRIQQYRSTIDVSSPLSIGVTEWNVFLNQKYWHINRTLQGGVITAEWFIRLLNQQPDLPVVYAEQFALGGGNLSLIRSQTNGSIAPMGYVFQGFSNWPGSRLLSISVDSPKAQAYDREVPYVTAAAALSADDSTLRLAVVNNAESTSIIVTLQMTGFTPVSAKMWRLTADSYTANNDQNPTNVVLQEEMVELPLTTLMLPPHSVTFLELYETAIPTATSSATR